jgi:hypothetical protein
MPDRPILLIQCPSCLHANTPGEYFCAACGVPLHLKPCPTCGKVDDAAAKTCSACGAAFPTLAPDQYVLADDVRHSSPVATARPADTPGTPPPLANRAWPLVIVALVAGGIPFLWMYRANMPLPKAWQVQGQNAAGSAVTPAPLPVAVPPAASVATSAPAEPTPESKDLSPRGGAAPGPAADKAAQADQAKATQVGPVAANRKPVAKPGTKPVMAGRPVPPGPCTEGLAALDLCNHNQDSARK